MCVRKVSNNKISGASAGVHRQVFAYKDWFGADCWGLIILADFCREFVSTWLPKFQQENPQLTVVTSVHRGAHPSLTAEYRAHLFCFADTLMGRSAPLGRYATHLSDASSVSCLNYAFMCAAFDTAKKRLTGKHAADFTCVHLNCTTL